ncbi:MAG: NAD(P)/FAD-dependent oxidoreductase [Candidatus Bathyarchaeota archaeon]|nr:NAD(P)/FAD-dependent oxidoreductase [Candidatus Bathyarchaeota archaeon]
MSKNSVIIIGAGIGGLSAGCYAQMSGLDSQIFEVHNKPGGQCTAWKRSGYVFDGCIHHLAGCRPGYLLYSMWEELGALPTRTIIFPEDMTQVEDENGKAFHVYTDLDRLQQHMKEIAPQDASAIDRYIKSASGFTHLDLLETALLSGGAFAKRLPSLLKLARLGAPMKVYAEKFKNPFLRKAFPTIQYDWPDTPVFVHLNMIGNCDAKNYGVPVGGSLEFSKAIEQRYRRLGGELNYNSYVKEVLVEDNKAVGVKLVDETLYKADVVVSDAFAYTTIFDLLGGRFGNQKIRNQYSTPSDNAVMGIQVSFGLARDLSKEPRAMVLFLKKPVKIADREHDRLDLELFGYDPTLAPVGNSVLKILLDTSYSFWKDLYYDNHEKYEKEKAAVAETLLTELETRFPDITSQVEAQDVATPITMERYTGVGQGFENKLGFFEGMSLLKGPPQTLPRLKNFYMIGATAGGAGIPGCAAQGRNLIRKICREKRVPFTPTKS